VTRWHSLSFSGSRSLAARRCPGLV
jgi:hypothetical protein